MENIKSRLKNSDKNSMMLLLIAVLIFGIMAVLAPSSFLGHKKISRGLCTQISGIRPEFHLA